MKRINSVTLIMVILGMAILGSNLNTLAIAEVAKVQQSAVPAPEAKSTQPQIQLQSSNPVQTARAKELMTKQELAQYRGAIKTAPTPEVQRQIRELTYVRLSQRAADRGVVLIEPTLWIATIRWNETPHAQICVREPHPNLATKAGPIAIKAEPVVTASHPTVAKPVATASATHPVVVKAAPVATVPHLTAQAHPMRAPVRH